jgi:hypothetical protein
VGSVFELAKVRWLFQLSEGGLLGGESQHPRCWLIDVDVDFSVYWLVRGGLAYCVVSNRPDARCAGRRRKLSVYRLYAWICLLAIGCVLGQNCLFYAWEVASEKSIEANF